MRLSVVLGFAACFLLPLQSQAAWDIFQSYVILDSGSGDQFLAGGLNADGATAFAGTDLGDFTATDALTLNGGELKTYKNGSSNVCGGTLNYRVYASGDTPGAFTALALPFSADLGNGDQQWAASSAGIDLLGALTAGDYVLELYWEATGDDAGGCSDTKYDSNFGNNFTATFSIVVPGCTDPAYAEYDAAATSDDGSCSTLIDVPGCTDPAYGEYDPAATTDDGSCTTLLFPCISGTPVLGDITVVTPASKLDTADAEISIDVTDGTATGLTLTGITVNSDYTFTLPGTLDGILPGVYSAKVTDVDGCISNSVTCIIGFDLCCDCGVSDTDGDGICDDTDNCTDKLAINFADPANGGCLGCTDQDAENFVSYATVDDGSCIFREGCTDPAADNFDLYAVVDDGSCTQTEGCTDPDYANYVPTATIDDGSCLCFIGSMDPCTSPTYDGYTYDVVQIGCQCWFAENLRTTTFNDGTPLASSYSPAWGCNGSGDNPRWHRYGDSPSPYNNGCSPHNETVECHSEYHPDFNVCDPSLSLENYGRLYNQYAVFNGSNAVNESNICPNGWHVPEQEEFEELLNFVEVSGYSAAELRRPDGWQSIPNSTGTITGGPATSQLGNTWTWAGGGQSKGQRFKVLETTVLKSVNAHLHIVGRGSLYPIAPDDTAASALIHIVEDAWTPPGTDYGFGIALYEGPKVFEQQFVFTSNGSHVLELNVELPPGDYFLRLEPVQIPSPQYVMLDSYNYPSGALPIDIGGRLLLQENTTDPINVFYGDYYWGFSEWTLEDPSPTSISNSGNRYGFNAEASGKLSRYKGKDYSIAGAPSTYDEAHWEYAGLVGSWWTSTMDSIQVGSSTYYGARPMTLSSTEMSFAKSHEAHAIRCIRNRPGCTDSNYLEYDPAAPVDDGSCITPVVEGCTDPTAPNYDPAANTDDGSCIYYGCIDPTFLDFDPTANTDDGSCSIPIVEGCMDPAASNYDASANVDDGSCLYPGCTDPDYLEFDPDANTDDGSCSVLIVPGCTDPDYAEYDAAATLDDGSCECLIVDPACVSPTMDGYNYDVVQIGCQCWFAENLRTTVYRNGDSIPADLTESEYASTTSGASFVAGQSNMHDVISGDSIYCSLYNCNICGSPPYCADPDLYVQDFGRWYNWYATRDARGVCPSGWHVPYEDEWDELLDYLVTQGYPRDVYSSNGLLLQAGNNGQPMMTTSGWITTNGTDEFGFAGKPGGEVWYLGDQDNFTVEGIGSLGQWWSSSLPDWNAAGQVKSYHIDDLTGQATGGNYPTTIRLRAKYSGPDIGSSIRCIKD